MKTTMIYTCILSLPSRTGVPPLFAARTVSKGTLSSAAASLLEARWTDDLDLPSAISNLQSAIKNGTSPEP